MLVISRQKGQSLLVNGVLVHFSSFRGSKVRVAFGGKPLDKPIVRLELLPQEEQQRILEEAGIKARK